jgi:hypothetical protein
MTAWGSNPVPSFSARMSPSAEMWTLPCSPAAPPQGESERDRLFAREAARKESRPRAIGSGASG